MKNRNSKKGFTLVEIMIVVVIIGLLAAMAIPAFSKVRENSRKNAITNNLRQIASAGQQYILEQGLETVTFTTIEGSYFADIQPVASESYDLLDVDEAGGVLVITTPGGQRVAYTY